MVKVGILLLLPFLMWADEVKVETLLDQTSFYVDTPITGTIDVTHSTRDAVDASSFTYHQKHLPVDFLRTINFPGPNSLNIDSYRFKLPPSPEGLQVIDPISVKVTGKVYSSIPVSYEVKKMQSMSSPPASSSPSSASSASSPPSLKPFLKLEMIFLGNPPFYPGQKANVGYRYLFRGDIDLRQEVVPLLDQKIFLRLGEKQIQDSQQGTLSVRDITQQIQFGKPGDYEIPEAFISGYAYKSSGGSKVYFEPKLTSSVTPLKIHVSPFPSQGKPPFFKGAIGPFEISAKVNSPPRLEVGDKFILLLTFKGEGVLSTLTSPNLMSQPGWAGFFQVGDLPPQGKKKEGEVTYAYELKAISLLTDHIPPIYLAYFDPQKASYQIVKSATLPLNVEGKPRGEEKPSAKEFSPPVIMEAQFKVPTTPPAISLIASDYDSRPFGGPWVLLLIPASLLLFWLRIVYREREEEKRKREPTLDERLSRAQKALPDLRVFVVQAEAALRAVWKGDPLPEKVQRYLDGLEAALWGQEKPCDPEVYYAELRELCMPNGNQK